MGVRFGPQATPHQLESISAHLDQMHVCKCGRAIRGNGYYTHLEYCAVAMPLLADDEARFWSKVHKTETCWLWTAGTRAGYGVFRFCGRRRKAHRLAYLWAVGSVPGDLLVLHSCDVKACMRPDHLYLGTDGDNSRDRWARHPEAPRWRKQLRERMEAGHG